MNPIYRSMSATASFYDGKKVGDVGPLGFRRSTDLSKLVDCIGYLIDKKILIPNESLFLDMGCADGRVNVLFSYITKASIGIELDEWSLDEYDLLKEELKKILKGDRLILPPPNISLFHGNSIDDNLYKSIKDSTGVEFKDIDLFYTYLTMQYEFANYILRNGKRGAIFMVYGLDRIMPRYEGLTILTPDKPLGGILAVYRKD